MFSIPYGLMYRYFGAKYLHFWARGPINKIYRFWSICKEKNMYSNNYLPDFNIMILAWKLQENVFTHDCKDLGLFRKQFQLQCTFLNICIYSKHPESNIKVGQKKINNLNHDIGISIHFLYPIIPFSFQLNITLLFECDLK